jgi:hypothetical protein
VKLSRSKLLGYRKYIHAIEDAVEALDKYDRAGGYGDMAQNFETSDRSRITTELLKMIGDQITRGNRLGRRK